MAAREKDPASNQLVPLGSLRAEIDRVFEDFFRGWVRPLPQGRPATPGAVVPSIDLKETDSELIVSAAVPGVAKDRLKVFVQDDRVLIEGEHRAEQHRKEEVYHWRESSVGRFQRVVPLPVKVVPERARARLEHGILILTLPKAEPSRKEAVEIVIE